MPAVWNGGVSEDGIGDAIAGTHRNIVEGIKLNQQIRDIAQVENPLLNALSENLRHSWSLNRTSSR